MRFIVCMVLTFYSLSALAQVDKILQSQLVKMSEQNQEIRQSLSQYASGDVPAALQSVATEIDNLHTQTLKEIIRLYGWPSKQQVEEEGVQATFLLIKHSKDLALQQDMLPLIIQSYLDKEGIAGQDVAQFTDNVSIKLGKKQVFGTQAEFISGKVIFAPIENQDSVDQLRAQMSMPSLAEYKKTLELFYGVIEPNDDESL